MDRCKGQYSVILFFLSVFSTSCISRPSSRPPAVITGIVLTENSIRLEVETSRPSDSIVGLSIAYKNIPGGMSFDIEVKEERQERFHTVVTLIFDITDMPRVVFNEIEIDELLDERGFLPQFLAINQEAELTVSMRPIRTWIVANIFIGEDRIDILEQHFFSRGWR